VRVGGLVGVRRAVGASTFGSFGVCTNLCAFAAHRLVQTGHDLVRAGGLVGVGWTAGASSFGDTSVGTDLRTLAASRLDIAACGPVGAGGLVGVCNALGARSFRGFAVGTDQLTFATSRLCGALCSRTNRLVRVRGAHCAGDAGLDSYGIKSSTTSTRLKVDRLTAFKI